MPSRVLLISANRCESPDPVFPLGLAFLDAALRRHGHITQWLDQLAQTERPADVIASFRPDFIGISWRNVDDFTSTRRADFYDALTETMRGIRQQTSSPVILGGSGFSIFPRELLRLAEADFGIQGEGEESLIALMDCLESRRDYSGVAGLVHRVNGHIIVNPQRPMSSPGDLDLTQIPEALVRYYLSRSSMIGLQTQRGCSFPCSYCTYPLIEGRASRRRSPDAVAVELEEWSRRGVPYFFMVDSVFNSSAEHAAAICEAILRRGLRIRWGCFLRPQGLSRDLMRLMAAAGVTHVEFGSDSFCDAVLDAYDKRFHFEDILQSSRLTAGEGIEFCHFLIIGGPGETAETLRRSFENSSRLPDGTVLPIVGMRVYPGTALAAQCRREHGHDSTADLPEPHCYLAPELTREGIERTLQEFARQSPQWVVGDPPPSYRDLTQRLRSRGVAGPLWSYLSALRRLTPEPRGETNPGFDKTPPKPAAKA